MFRSAFFTSLVLLVAAPSAAQVSHAGLYRSQGPDVASALELAADGRFRYQRSEGALDEEASGRWTATGDGVLLETLPHPRPPEWQINTIGESAESPLSVIVKVTGGDSLAGIFLRIGFINGDRMAGSTQFDGWSMPPDDERQPAWIEFSEPIHGVASQRFDLPQRRGMALNVTLVPNEIGIAAFDKTPATVTRDGLVLHWRGEDIRYSRVGLPKVGEPRFQVRVGEPQTGRQ